MGYTQPWSETPGAMQGALFQALVQGDADSRTSLNNYPLFMKGCVLLRQGSKQEGTVLQGTCLQSTPYKMTPLSPGSPWQAPQE